MTKFILDISFVLHYVDSFYSDNNVNKMLDIALSSFTNGKPIFIIPLVVIEQAKEIYPERTLVLDSLFGLCEKTDVESSDKIDTLIKICAIYEIDDNTTYVLADDNFIIQNINKTTHKAINIGQAREILGLNSS